MPSPTIARLRTLLAPPAFVGDEEKALQARQLHMIALGGAATIALWAIGVGVAVPELRHRAPSALSILAVFAIAFALNKAGSASASAPWSSSAASGS